MNNDTFMRAFERAFERRKQLSKQQQSNVQHVHKVNSDVIKSNVDDADVTHATPANQFDEEKYKAKIISMMKALIAKQKSITA